MKSKSAVKQKSVRKEPFYVQLKSDAVVNADGLLQQKTRAKYADRERKRESKESRDIVDDKISKRILEQARLQMEEEQQIDDDDRLASSPIHSDMLDHACIADDEDEDIADDARTSAEYSDFEEYEDFEEEMSGAGHADLTQFMPDSAPERRNLATIIMEKMREHEEKLRAGKVKTESATQQPSKPALNGKIIEVYTKVGTILSRYKSGKLPKAFKIIPALSNWEEILHLTKPESWTPNAMYEATRIFASNLKPKMAQRFYNLILLDAVREDLSQNKKINCHLYNALKKAVYKPAAWFKGILLPMVETGCTLREALVVGSVLSKLSIPVLHSAAALLKLAEMEYNGATSIFMRILLDKKYALPFRVVDALVFHFIRFKGDTRKMPVLWHQCLLVFCQRYKEDLAPDQKEAILELIKYHNHTEISAEVRRELMNSKCRDEMEIQPSTLPQTSQMAADQLMRNVSRIH